MKLNSRFRRFLSIFMVFAMLMQYGISLPVFAGDDAGSLEQAAAAQEAKAAKEAEEKEAAERAAAEKAAAEKAAAEKAAAEKAAAEKAAAEKAAAEKAAAEKAAAEKAASEQQSSQDNTAAPQQANEPEQKQEESQGQADTGRDDTSGQEQLDLENARAPDAEVTSGDEADSLQNEEPAAEEAAEDVSEEEETDEEEEEEFPAKTFSGSANGISVTVKAPEGAFPEGTTIRVSGASASGYTGAIERIVDGHLDAVRGVDISFYKDGSRIQPKKAVRVSMTSSVFSQGEDHTVFHVSGGGLDVVSSGGSGNTASFSAKSFSVYLMAASTASYEVNFVANGSVVETKFYDKTDAEVLGTLPDAPTKSGASFKGWKISGQDDFVSSSTVVTSDLTINAVYSDMTVVRFVMNNGSEEELVAQYDLKEGTRIGNLPEDPFKEGSVFDKWVNQKDGSVVTADTLVPEGGMTAAAQFKEINVYEATVTFFYMVGTERVEFGSESFELGDSDLPYTVNVPASTQVKPEHDPSEPTYYPSRPTIVITADDFDEDGKFATEVEYVEYTAEYDYVYMIKGADGEYTEIPDSREHIHGVIGSSVTPAVKDFPFADFERVESYDITKASGQELPVYYTPKTLSLTFDTDGGSYVAGVNAPYGTEVSLSDKTSEKEGYEFAGWYLDKECTEEAGGSVTIEDNMTLYAKWTPENVSYTIVYMFEKYNDAGTESSYVYDNSEQGSAEVGSVVTASDSSVPDKTRKGWEKDTAKNAGSSVEVKADGSSVMYVYYKLREYTFNFNAGTYTTGGWGSTTHNVTATLTGKGVSGTGRLNYTMTVKLGQNIASAWPAAVTGTYRDGGRTQNVGFDGWKPDGQNVRFVTKRITVTDDMLPGSGSSITYTAQWTRNADEITVNYWLQNADNNRYTRSELYSQTYTSSSGNLQPKDITGYTYDHSENKTDRWGNVTEYNFYYNRDAYDIEYYDGGSELGTIRNVKFDATISGDRYNWTPANPAGKEDYTWGGWYEDSDLSSKYTFSTMPAHDLRVYAKWIAPQYTVTYDLQGGTADFELSETVDKGSKVSFPGTPVKEHYTFDGWYTAAEGGQRYDWNTPVTEDITIYARWKPVTLTYTVHYYKAGTTDKVLADKVVTNPALVAGQTVTENAPGVAGYRPDETSKSVELGYDTNEIIFYYSERSGKVTYTVNYVLKDHPEIKAHESKTVEVDASTVQVIELAASANNEYIASQTSDQSIIRDSYYPLQGAQSLVLAADESANVITFTYANYKTTEVTVNYVDMDGNAIPGKAAIHEYLKKGTTFQVDTAAPNGYHFHHVTDNKGESHTTYNITGEGQLIITVYYQKSLTIIAGDETKPYDGTPLTSKEGLAGLASMPELETGHTLTNITFTGSQTAVGSHSTVPSAAVIEGCSEDYYHITYVPGTLTVTPVEVLITIDPDRYTNAEYDGTDKTAGFTNPAKNIGDYVTISVKAFSDAHLRDFEGLMGKALITQTNAGDYQMTSAQVEAAVRRLIDLPTDDNYQVRYQFRNAQLKISPKEAVISAGDDSKKYGENDPDFADASITGGIGTDLDGIDLAVSRTNTDEEVGEYPGVLTIGKTAQDLNTEYPNYTFTVNAGDFSITQADADELGLDAENYSGEYDGAGHSITASATVTEGTTIYYSTDNSTWSTTAPEWTDVTDGAMTVYVKAENDNYETATASATVTITKKKITVSDTANRTYNGVDQTLEIGASKAQGVVSGETLSLSSAAITGKNAGTYTEVSAYEWGVAKADGSSSTGNYDIEVSGTLNIAPKAVTVTPDNGSKTYDGDSSNPGTYTATAEGLIGEDSISYTVSRAVGEDAGTYDILVSGDVDQGNYSVSYNKGTFTIDPAELVVRTGSGSKPYDGTALTSDEASIEGLVEGETASVTAKGSQTEVGSSENGYEIEWGTAKADNYTITEHLGTLTVTEAEEEEVIPTPPTPPTPEPDPTPTPTPTPDPTPTPTPTPTTDGGDGNPAAAPAAPAVPAAVVTDDPVPQAEPAPQEVIDEPAPLAAPQAPWALINLICAALATIGAAIALFRRKEDDEEDDEDRNEAESNEDENDSRGRNMAIAKVLGAVLAAASVIIFILTEDMSGPMQMTDKWTILMAVLFAGQAATAIAVKRAAENDEEDEEEAEA